MHQAAPELVVMQAVAADEMQGAALEFVAVGQIHPVFVVLVQLHKSSINLTYSNKRCLHFNSSNRLHYDKFRRSS
jgi:hypothetical protein